MNVYIKNGKATVEAEIDPEVIELMQHIREGSNDSGDWEVSYLESWQSRVIHDLDQFEFISHTSHNGYDPTEILWLTPAGEEFLDKYEALNYPNF